MRRNILPTVDKDGTEDGSDFNLINEASKAINLPNKF